MDDQKPRKKIEQILEPSEDPVVEKKRSILRKALFAIDKIAAGMQLVPEPAVAGTGMVVQNVASTISGSQTDPLPERLKNAILELEETKLNKEYLESGEFNNLVRTALESAAFAESEQQILLVQEAFQKSLTYESNDVKKKAVLIALMRGMDPIEFQILKAALKVQNRSNTGFAREHDFDGILRTETNTQLSYPDLELWCHILASRGLMHFLKSYPHENQKRNKWHVNVLGQHLLKLVGK